jgi:predicted DNA binding protein
MELQRLHSPETPTVDGQYMLTDTQRETIQLAHELGYYDIPRDVTMADLASELDVSQQALSKRLRRAHETITQHLLAGGPELDIRKRG